MHTSKKELSPKNCGQGLTEYALILTLVAATAILILAVVGVDISEVFSRINQAIGFSDNDLPPGTIEVTLVDKDGNGVTGSYVYAFDDSGNWLGLYERTDSEGVATFEDMNDGAYQFLAYRSPHYYWSIIISFPKQNQTTIQMNVQEFTVTVLDEKGKGISNVYVYAYTANERYWLGVNGITGTDGKVVLDLPDGDYKFRAYTSGHYYWSAAINSPAQNSTVIEVQDYRMTVTVVDDAGKGVKESGLYVYAYTQNGNYAGVYGTTNGNGRVKLEVPSGSYKFRVYYRADNYWSDVVSVPGTDETEIKTEERPYSITVVDESGQPIKNVWVYAYTGGSAYTGLSDKTNNQGVATIDIPRGNFKFRADYKGQSYWSSTISTSEGSNTTITLK